MENIKQILDKTNFDINLFYNVVAKNSERYIFLGNLNKNLYSLTEKMKLDLEFNSNIIDENFFQIFALKIKENYKPLFFKNVNNFLENKIDNFSIELDIKIIDTGYIWSKFEIYKNDDGFIVGVISKLKIKSVLDFSQNISYKEQNKKLSEILDDSDMGAVLLLGIDNFERINNINDRIFGDVVLRVFIETIRQLLPKDAYLYHYEGDQFFIIYKNATMEESKSLYILIRSNISKIKKIDSKKCSFTISGGISMYGAPDADVLYLIKNASSALSLSKKRGKNICTFFSKEYMDKTLREMKIAEELHNDVINNFRNFSIVFQPIVDTETLETLGAEALLRWKSGEFGDVSPDEFIPILENENLICITGEWIFEQSLCSTKKCIEIKSDFFIHINASNFQLMKSNFCDFVRRAIEITKVAGNSIVIELTESNFVSNMDLLKNVYEELRKMNIKVAMDDFGTGYSSFGLLSQNPPDIIKIDKIFVNSIKNNKFNQTFIKSIINICREVNIDVCIEGVEYYDELDIIRKLKPKYVQGFYISMPVSEKIFIERFL